MTDKEKIKELTALLNDCLEGMNQEDSFKVLGIIDNKFHVAFDIEEIDDELYFAGY